MARRVRSLVVAAGALLAGLPGLAAAHPHVWLANVTTFVFEGRYLSAVRLTWAFDEFFGPEIIARFDANANGRFEPAEVAALEAGAFASLKDYRYLTHVLLDGREIAVERVERFRADIRHGRLIYEFAVPLPKPVEPSAVEVIVTVYDESHFVEATLDPNDPVRFDGMALGQCAYAIREAAGSPGDAELAPYQLVSLICRAP